MDTHTEYPQFYHVEDLYGNVFALVCRDDEHSFTVIQRRDVRKSFVISKVTSEEAVKEIAPGQLLGASSHDYYEVLLKEFLFSFNPIALYHTKQDGEKADVEKTILEDDEPTEPNVQEPNGSDEGNVIEQPADPDTEHNPADVEHDQREAVMKLFKSRVTNNQLMNRTT